MKLYTEEQIKEFFKEHYFLMERDLDNLKPIELPSDEEIEKESDRYLAPHAFREGAKWVIEQIKQQQDEKQTND